jgi:hypothetical protein
MQTDDLDEEADPHAVASPEETARAQARTAFRTRVWSELDAIYRELAGPRYRPSPGLTKMRTRILALAPEEAYHSLFRRMAEERAGLRPPPTADQLPSLPAGERFWRLWAGLGDRFEDFLGTAIGRDRAAALRKQRGGWYAKFTYGPDCQQ